jgi:CIC family chloride channel protein
LIELPDLLILNFEITHDSPLMRFAIPVLGMTLLWIYWRTQPSAARRVGVTHLYEHLSYHHGELPLRNLFNQLIGAVFAIGTGQPVGREGPGVHIGAALSSWLGVKAGVSYNYQRLLIGCGSAAAIAALFNTPLAGVLFAMEVILLEYSLTGFTAIIVAAISADAVTRHLFGAPELLGFGLGNGTVFEQLPILILLSIVIGFAGLIFQQITVYLASHRSRYLSINLLGAGVLVGGFSLLDPSLITPVHIVMQQTLIGVHEGNQLLLLALFYLLVPPILLGLGIPGGLIGPSLTSGALLGALIGVTVSGFDIPVDTTTLSLVGMAAMLSAVIHAPLAALIAVFELSGSIQTLTLAMMVIVLSDLIMRSLFRKPSIFERLLMAQGLSRDTRLYRRVMMSTSVQELMDRSLSDRRGEIMNERFTSNWYLVKDDKGVKLLANDEITSENQVNSEETRFALADVKSSLFQALEQLQSESCDRLVVTNNKGAHLGVLTRREIDLFYRNAEV